MFRAMSFHRFMRMPAAAIALAAALLLPFAGAQAGAAKRPIVVELFTSQGCDSCPPADAILGQLATTRKDVLAMSLPITYWDMLGWRDTLASEADTKRQKAYAQAMGHGGVYTPEMIVDGISDVVGSREAQVDQAIATRAADAQNVPVNVSATKTEVRVTVGSSESRDDATIWFFRLLPQASVTVTAGENAGHTMTYRNVVRDIRAVGMWKGQPVTLDLPREDLIGKSRDSIAVVVQQGGYGRIVGAAVMDGH